MTIDKIIHQKKDRPNSGFNDDDRRALSTAFNDQAGMSKEFEYSIRRQLGDLLYKTDTPLDKIKELVSGVDHLEQDLGGFTARYAQYDEKRAGEDSNIIGLRTGSSKVLLYMFDGSSQVRLNDENDATTDCILNKGDRLFIPPQMNYNLHSITASKYFIFDEDESCIYDSRPNILDNFNAKQVKFATVKKDTILGGHYHPFNEFFYLLDGEAEFKFRDPLNKDAKVTSHPMKKGDTLFVPARVAHKAFLVDKSILVGFTEEPYIAPQYNDYKLDEKEDPFYNPKLF